MTTPVAEPKTKAERAAAQVQHNNGECILKGCRCEAFENAGFRDGFLTCSCHHTKWSHRNTWVPGRATVTP